MRALAAGLLAAQRAVTGTPACSVTVGGTVYTSRLKRLQHIERPYGGTANILLDNSDGGITTDLRGAKVVIGYGFSGQGESTAAPLWVYSMLDRSLEGELTVQLDCMDVWHKLRLNKIIAGGGQVLTGTIEGTIQTGMKVTGGTSAAKGTVLDVAAGYIVVSRVTNGPFVAETVTVDGYATNKITVSSVADFGGGSAPGWGSGESTIWEMLSDAALGLTDIVSIELDVTDNIIDSYQPVYVTEVMTPILSIIQDLVQKTTCAVRAENDEKLHFFDFSSAPGTPDYTYVLTGDHKIISDIRDTSLILPNHIIVIGAEFAASEVNSYYGEATDAAAIARFMAIKEVIVNQDIASDADCTQEASSRLTRIQKEATRGVVEVPMNCGQELFDYVRITDSRANIDYYGWVGSLEHRWEPGVYRLIIGLGGLTGAERLPDDRDYPLPNIMPPIVPPVSMPPSGYWVIPASIQGYHHDIVFTSVDQDTVSWTSGTVKFYDGTSQNISAGSHDLANSLVHYIYFDLDDANPNVLKVTSDYLGALTLKTGVVCMIQKGSGTTVKATVIPSYGKEPLITADVIYLTGLLDLLPNGTYGKTLSTCISAGRITLEECKYNGSVIEGSYDMVLATEISAGHIKLTSGAVIDGTWYNTGGITIDATTGMNIGPDKVKLSSAGIQVYGQVLNLYNSSSVFKGYLYGATNLTLASSSGVPIQISASNANLFLSGSDIMIGNTDIIPNQGVTNLGSSTLYFYMLNTRYVRPKGTTPQCGDSNNKWAWIWRTNESACELPTSNSALDIIRKIPSPKLKEGDYGRRHYFSDKDMPDELKVRPPLWSEENQDYEDDMGEPEIEFTRLMGVLTEATREIVDKLDSIEVKVIELEGNK